MGCDEYWQDQPKLRLVLILISSWPGGSIFSIVDTMSLLKPIIGLKLLLFAAKSINVRHTNLKPFTSGLKLFVF